MIDEIRFGGLDREKIVVQTRKGTPLDNYVALQASFQQDGMYRAFRRKYGTNWEPRKPATGVYNCAGMVWASRRAALPDPLDWERILVEDDFRLVGEAEEPTVGDIAVYRLADTGEITHVARVCRVDRLDTLGRAAAGAIVRALSKWNNSYGEDIHAVADVFLDGGAECKISYYTDRPVKNPREWVERLLIGID